MKGAAINAKGDQKKGKAFTINECFILFCTF